MGSWQDGKSNFISLWSDTFSNPRVFNPSFISYVVIFRIDGDQFVHCSVCFNLNEVTYLGTLHFL